MTVAACAVALATCIGSPTGPGALPAAQLSARGPLRPLSCALSTCTFQGEAINLGLGCANTARGITRFEDGGVEFARTPWNLRILRRVIPNEVFIYEVEGPRQLPAGWTYRTEIFWNNIPC